MKYMLPLMLAACVAAGDSDFDSDSIVTLEGYGFGLSYHSNRSVDWNETNYGLGIGLASRERGDTFETIAVAATYRDSFNEQAYLLQAGFRKTFGDYDAMHASIGLTLGFLHGSGYKGGAVIPVVSVGYDWLDLCATYIPPMNGLSPTGIPTEQQGTDPKDNRDVDTSVIAVFVRVRLCRF